ncbi:MAG: methyltransferase domain-containing protein [Candidatus Aureabacteria bacterium]|nr:methyltransferase domain-containing protein [Candidatus Auribacterota bacterium]
MMMNKIKSKFLSLFKSMAVYQKKLSEAWFGRRLTIKTIINKILNKIINKIKKILNRFGSKKKCYICNRTFNYFTKYRNGTKGIPEFHKRLNGVGSDIDNFGCMYCGSHDRERHLYMFFDALKLWKKMKNAKILHFAPEINLPTKIMEQSPLEYFKADLYPQTKDVKKIDATKLPFSDETFDFIISNHILEHIPDYNKALCEFYRVIKPGGIQILQTPYSKLLKNNFEDKNIDTDELRLFFYGQKDHVRIFGEYQFLKSIEDVGFNLQIKKHKDFFDDHMAFVYGVNKKEDLILVVKPTDNSILSTYGEDDSK